MSQAGRPTRDRWASIGVAWALPLLLVIGLSSQATAWSNGGYSADPTNPDYGTHDWIAEHALDWLPAAEKKYLVDNLAVYLYGTELPDNGGAPDGIGDNTLHHVYYYSDGSLQDDAAAVRASAEFSDSKAYLAASDYRMATKTAGIMAHYITDLAVFGHVMGKNTDWGAEDHHSDYENYVRDRTTSYTSAMFDPYLTFNGALEIVSADSATLQVAYDTTFGDGATTENAPWMDANYDWSDPTFRDSAGASLNRATNALADVLHTLAIEADYPPPVEPPPPEEPPPPAEPPPAAEQGLVVSPGAALIPVIIVVAVIVGLALLFVFTRRRMGPRS